MGVTLAAGYSLTWFKDVFAADESFDDLLTDVGSVPVGSNGIDGSYQRKDFVRAVLEGIIFSLNESIEIFRRSGKESDTIFSIDDGAKNEAWLQIQADIFDAKIIRLDSDQRSGMGAAMLAAYWCGWFDLFQQFTDVFLKVDKQFIPNQNYVEKYKKIITLYQDVYNQTKTINEKLLEF